MPIGIESAGTRRIITLMRMTRLCLAVLAALAATTTQAVAETTADGYPRPAIELMGDWGPIVVSVLFLALIAAVAFKNARRTHLD